MPEMLSIQSQIAYIITSIPSGIDSFDAESDLRNLMLNADTSYDSYSKNSSLLKSYAVNSLFPLNSTAKLMIQPLIWRRFLFLESLLYDNSSPRPPEEFNFENPTEYFSPSPIPVEDSDSLMEEIDIFFDGDKSIPPDIPVDVPNILTTHPALLMDFDFIPSNNDVGSDLDDSSPSGDRNKITFPECLIVESIDIKECSSCGALYTSEYCCFKEGLVDKIICDLPDSSQRPPPSCARCGTPVDGPQCRGCALLRKKFKEDLFTYCVENGIFQDLQDTSESSDDNTNVVNAPQEPFVVKQDPDNPQSPPHIDHCCYECGDSFDDIFCQRCTCKFCGKGAHIGYNCPTQIPIITNPEPCYNQDLNEILQNLQSLQQQKLFGTCQQCGCNEYDGVCFYCTVGNGTPINFSTPYSSNDSPSVANHPPQPQSTILLKKKSELQKSKRNKFAFGRLPNCSVMTRTYTIAIDPSFHPRSPGTIETIIDSNNDYSSSDDDSYKNIDYVDASPPDAEIVSLEVVEIVIPKVGGIDDDILLTIKDDILHEKLLNVNLLIANIEALKDNPAPSSNVMTNGSTTTLSDYSLPDYEAFYDDHIEKRMSRIFEASCARGFVLRSQELQILSFIWESDILILSTNVYL
ncbi:hypothetical protein Tco_0120702 [Tanacetum coccineum]